MFIFDVLVIFRLLSLKNSEKRFIIIIEVNLWAINLSLKMMKKAAQLVLQVLFSVIS